jgi:hypothetical protein
MFDYQLYGLNAGGYHLTNLVLHILSTLLLFWLFNRMTKEIWKSAFVAAFFALHPLHVESVAWVSERKDVLSAFFWMLTLCLYVYYTQKPAVRRYLLVVFAFVLALMSKPMVITLPVIMILLDYWPLRRLQSQGIATDLTDVMPISTSKGKNKKKSKKEALKKNIFPSNDRKLPETKIAGIIPSWQLWEKIPFFILSAVLSIITFCAPNKQETFLKGFPLGSRLVNAPVSFVSYIEKTFWPHNLAVFYPFPEQITLWKVLIAIILIIIINAVVIIKVRRLPYLFVGWLWYAITILPVIGIIQISLKAPYAMADRYHYLPSIGIACMMAWGFPLLIKCEDMRKKILIPVGVVFIVILSFLTWQQCGYWKNSIGLWNHTLQVTKNNYLAHNNLGIAFSKEGKIEEAIYHYNEVIRINPDYPLAYYNRGNAYYNLDQYHLAIEDYNEAIRLNPDYTKAYNNRAAFNLNEGNKELGCHDAQKACELGNCKMLEDARVNGDCR